MERKQALKLIEENIGNKNLRKHALAVEAAMKELARFFNEDESAWGLCGLLHDLDYEKTKDSFENHSKMAYEMLKELAVNDEICEAVLSHNYIHGIKPKTLMAKALYCVDGLTGLIVASTLVLPSKEIAQLTAENVLNRFKEKAFSRNIERKVINQCWEMLGISLEDFVAITLKAMQSISGELGL